MAAPIQVSLLAGGSPKQSEAPKPLPAQQPQPQKPPRKPKPKPEPGPQKTDKSLARQETPQEAAESAESQSRNETRSEANSQAADAAANDAPPGQSDLDAPMVEARFDAAYLNNPRPSYPPMSRKLGEQGTAFIRVLVLPDGSAQEVQLKQSSGSPRLDRAALEAVRKWRFVPAKRGRTAIAGRVVVPIKFNLEP
jgi:protein TonB